MLEVMNYVRASENFAEVFKRAATNCETVVVTGENDQNVVIISLEKYNAMEKATANAAYLRKLEKSMEELRNGDFVVRSLAELESCESTCFLNTKHVKRTE